MTAMLASVTSLTEAYLAQAAGADIVDLKDPGQGALGALAYERIREIVEATRRAPTRKVPISATVGDLLLDDPEKIRERVAATAACGVDFVKLGLFAEENLTLQRECLRATGDVDTRKVLVMFADRQPAWHAWLPVIAEYGYAGAMLDTADKRKGGLCAWLGVEALRDFIAQTHALGLFAGLAGSLRASDIPRLLPLRPDYLGFRGALCVRQRRTHALEDGAVARIRALMYGATLDQAASF